MDDYDVDYSFDADAIAEQRRAKAVRVACLIWMVVVVAMFVVAEIMDEAHRKEVEKSRIQRK